jgi:hypothetical protein
MLRQVLSRLFENRSLAEGRAQLFRLHLASEYEPNLGSTLSSAEEVD